MLGHMILTLSMSGQPCDVTFREPFDMAWNVLVLLYPVRP
jgi:hypothetical protein